MGNISSRTINEYQQIIGKRLRFDQPKGIHIKQAARGMYVQDGQYYMADQNG